MAQAPSRSAARQKRHERIRLTTRGTAARPRLAVFRSIDQIYAQVIDDTRGYTLAAASTLDAEVRAAALPSGTVAAARAVGEAVARRALDRGVRRIVFDRGGYLYHGRVAAVAEGARGSGLEF